MLASPPVMLPALLMVVALLVVTYRWLGGEPQVSSAEIIASYSLGSVTGGTSVDSTTGALLGALWYDYS